MYIEFGLPTGAGGQAAAAEASRLRKSLYKWSEQYSVGYSAESVRHSHRYWIRLYFSDTKHYTLFLLTWKDRAFMGPTVVQESEHVPGL